MKWMDVSSLYLQWLSVHRALGVRSSFGEYLKICKHYTERHRHYHTLEHLVHCMHVLERHFADVEDVHLVKLALFYHDVIYNVKSKTNEADSAQYFLKYAKRKKLSTKVQEAVCELIELTASHKLSSEATTLQKIMNDVDMSIFTVDGPYYGAYSRRIWQEYRSVGKDAYIAGRLDFLKSVDPDTMFYTKPLRDQLDRAHYNIGLERLILERIPYEITS